MLAALLPQAALLHLAAPQETSLGVSPAESQVTLPVNVPMPTQLRAPRRPSPTLVMLKLPLERSLLPRRSMPA